MNIVGLEVLPGIPARENVALAEEKVELTYGQLLHVNTSFGYRGKALKVTLYGAIGNRKWAYPFWDIRWFDEVLHGENPNIELPESPTDFTPCLASVDIPITADISPGENYDLYCKIKEYPQVVDEVDTVITITGMPPTFELLEETIYPYSYVYDGKCDVSTLTFKTDPFSPASWMAGKLAAHVEDEVKKAGGRVMEMRVYVDKSPLFWSNWRIELVTTPAPATAGLGMSLGVWWLAPVIILALAIILIIVATLLIKTIIGAFTHKPISEEIKKTWSRPTLISVIGDFEKKLEMAPTPPEDLEKKTDQELRDYTNQLAKEIAPPLEGLGLGLAIAAAAVLGLGALALGAYAMSKRGTE